MGTASRSSIRKINNPTTSAVRWIATGGTMTHRSFAGLIGLVAALAMAGDGARAFDETKFPNMAGQWLRLGGGSFDPTKPAGLGQQAPLTPDYRAVLATSLA